MGHYGVGTSILPDTAAAAKDACAQVGAGLDYPSELVVLFVSPHHAEDLADAAAVVADQLASRVVVGCTGEGVIGGAQEFERQPAMAVWAASLPGVKITPFHATFEPREDGVGVAGWPRELAAEPVSTFLLLADPFTTPGTEFLGFLDHQHPGAKAVGGMSSGGTAPGENRLLIGDRIVTDGVVGVALSGQVPVVAVVSQGCRPVGARFLVTRADGNIIYELGGRPAFGCLQEMYGGLASSEQELARRGLHIGLTINESQSHFDRGDFLVRGLIGADQDEGSLAVGDRVHEGQTVQFHLRDRETASEDLAALLQSHLRVSGSGGAEAALLFSCNGRGRRLFGRSHHDVSLVRSLLGEIPVAGFFAQGEIGPVGGGNFLHGFTASLAIFGAPYSPKA